ncbi:Os11g0462950 [Oryza sativa Japonica Group]|uniref:Os11g0462950 protein n=1 Tax=Oryza sativa subsp. japonica TaxID=39947 RepID=A0A0P0Y2B9_ORYSJ|nr:hypothetical protein EE612_055438 [Oryza sativa]BAT13961.1 Os11g0462950 [Oryza sativa Japonica Group]
MVTLQELIHKNLIFQKWLKPESNPSSPKGHSLTSSFCNRVHPSNTYLSDMSVLPEKATDRVLIDFPYCPMYAKALSVTRPEVESLESFLQFITIAPKPSSIGSPVIRSGR